MFHWWWEWASRGRKIPLGVEYSSFLSFDLQAWKPLRSSHQPLVLVKVMFLLGENARVKGGGTQNFKRFHYMKTCLCWGCFLRTWDLPWSCLPSSSFGLLPWNCWTGLGLYPTQPASARVMLPKTELSLLRTVQPLTRACRVEFRAPRCTQPPLISAVSPPASPAYHFPAWAWCYFMCPFLCLCHTLLQTAQCPRDSPDTSPRSSRLCHSCFSALFPGFTFWQS